MRKMYKSLLAFAMIAGGAMFAQTAQADTLIGTATLTVKPFIFSSFGWGDEVDFQIAVMDAGQTTSDDPDSANPIYYITETDDKGYMPYNVNFEFNPGSVNEDIYPAGSATFNAQPEGWKDGLFWITQVMIPTPEFQDQYSIPFNLEDGPLFRNRSNTGNVGFGFAGQTKETDAIDPSYLSQLLGFQVTKVSNWTLAGSEPVTYPALDELLNKTYTFSSTYSETASSAYTFESNFDFELSVNAYSQQEMLGFIGNGFNPKFTYDEATGQIKLNASYFGTSANGYVVIVPEGSEFNGMATDKLVLQVSPEGEISCPSFAIYDFTKKTEIGSYSAITIAEPEPEVESYPALADLLNRTYAFSGTYSETASSAYTFESNFNFELSVNAYSQQEMLGFLGNDFNPKFTYDEATGQIKLNASYFGTSANGYVVIVPEGSEFNGMATDKLVLQVSPAGEISCPSFAIYDFTKKTEIGKYNAITIAEPEPEVGSIPTIDQLPGTYKFKADLTTFGDCPAALKSLLSGEFEFTINPGTSTQVNVSGFILGTNSANAEYDAETGILTYKSVYFSSNGYVYIAPAGEDGEPNYTGMAATVATYLKFQFNADGTVTIPDFYIGNQASNKWTTSYALYSNIQVTPPASSGEEPESKFEGTHEVTGGTTYFYGADGKVSATNGNPLVFEINEDNQLVSLLGYTCSEEELTENQRNTMKVNGNSIWMYTVAGNGFNWQYMTADPEDDPDGDKSPFYNCVVISGPAISGKPDTGYELTFTLNEDGTYSATPFTLWQRTGEWVLKDNTWGVDYTYTLLAKWDDTPYTGETPTDFEGEYELAGTYYNYTDGQQTSTTNGNFTLTINSANQIVTIADAIIDEWDLKDGKNTGTAKGNVLTWSPNIYFGLDWETTDLILLGGESTDSYTASGNVTFTLTDDDAVLSPFTVWKRTMDSSYNMTYTLLYKWDNTPFVQEPIVLPGTYELTGTFYRYASEDGEETYLEPQKENGDFTLEINDKFQPIQFGGYTLDPKWDNFDFGTAGENTVTWTSGFPNGMKFDSGTNNSSLDFYIGGASTEDLNEGDEIVFTKTSNTTYSLSPFTVWIRKMVGFSGVTNLLVKEWKPGTDTGVEGITIDTTAPVYFDLQGRKVNNPSNGVYIVKKGKDVKKVIIK